LSTVATASHHRPTAILLYILPVLLLPFVAQADLPRPSGPLGAFLVDSFVRVLVPLIALWLLARNLNVKPKDYGLTFSLSAYTPGQFAAASFLCFVGYMGYVIVNTLAQNWFVEAPKPPVTELEGLARSNLIVLVYLAATAGFFEEIIYRGVLGTVFLSGQSKVTGRIAYVLISTALFAAVHAAYGPAMVAACIYIGILTAGLYIWLGNLWILIAAHFATDLFVGVWAARHAAL
jgi:membrane protease YdiL (CAAX protease family)